MIISKRGSEEFSGFFISYNGPRQLILQLDGVNYQTDTGNINLYDNVCRHIAYRRESGKVDLFIDGELFANVAVNTTRDVNNNADIIIGSDEAARAKKTSLERLDPV